MREAVNTTYVQIKKSDAQKQVVYGEVYAPDRLDSQGDFMSAEVIEKMAWAFLRSGLTTNIDTEHSLKKNGCQVVESFVVRKGDPDFTPGAWVLGVWCPDAVWEQVTKGDINGFSMYGLASRREVPVEVEIPDDGILEGRVLKSDGHDHEVCVKIDDKGAIIGGRTSTDHGHYHEIKHGTVTEFAGTNEHSHRFSLSDVLAATIAKADKERPGWRSGPRTPDGRFSTADDAAGRGVTSPDSHPHWGESNPYELKA